MGNRKVGDLDPLFHSLYHLLDFGDRGYNVDIQVGCFHLNVNLGSCRGRESHHQDQCEHECAGDVNVSSFHDFDSFELIILFIGSLLIDLVPLGGLRSMLILYDSPSRLSCAAGVARIRLQRYGFRKPWCAHFHLDRGPCDFSRFFSFFLVLLAMQARRT